MVETRGVCTSGIGQIRAAGWGKALAAFERDSMPAFGLFLDVVTKSCSCTEWVMPPRPGDARETVGFGARSKISRSASNRFVR